MQFPISLFTSSLCAVALLAACHRGDHAHAPDHSDEGEHEHEEATAQITIWTNGYEVFAEHKAPAVGKPTPFVTHVTDLKTLKPRSNGSVTFVLRRGDTVIEHPHAAPERPGIYIPALTFPETGLWEITILIPADGTNADVALPPITVHSDAHSAAHQEFPEPPEGISFLKEQQWKILLQAEPATERTLIERIPVLGQTAAKPGFSASVFAPLAGQIVATSDNSSRQFGSPVKAGDLLASLQPRFSNAAAEFLEIDGRFAEAEAVLKQAQFAFERTKSLVAQEAKSPRELQEAEAALSAAQARHTSAAALRSTYRAQQPNQSTNASGIPIIELRAPISGIIARAHVGSGATVLQDQELFTIINPSTIWLEGNVPEAAISRLSNPTNALCEVLGGNEPPFLIASRGGRLVFTGLAVDDITRTLPLIYEMDNADANLRIGQSLRLHISGNRAEDGVAIPASALVEEGGLFVAFVQVSGETFERRELTLGIRDGDHVQVLEGIEEGERVVTKGAYSVRLAGASTTIPAHGHAH